MSLASCPAGACTDPNFLLYVDKGIAAREIKVTSQNFPDYVFSNNYSLLSIKELSEYIRLHHHLPEIPSSEQVKQNNGFEVGAMVEKLLQKIEEQTLYLIELQKQIDNLKAN